MESFTAVRFSVPESVTNAPVSDVASTRLRAGLTAIPDIMERCAQTAAENPGGALTPVPIAVPPRLTSRINSAVPRKCATSSSSVSAKASNSWPRNIGTAS
ncbi:hypothetical protein D9M72_514920 [compost metagenome]